MSAQSPTPTRFTLELEFVSLLSHPAYLSYLASTKQLYDPSFVRYLDYLQYWAAEPYVRYLPYPGPTLKALELLQREDFRRDVLKPDVLRGWMLGVLEGAAGVAATDEGRQRESC